MDLGDDKQTAQQAKAAREATQERDIVIRSLMQHKGGRNFLWWLLEQGSPFASSMRFDDGGRADPLRIAFAEGWRNLGTLIMGEVMRADPRGYILMLSENRVREEQRNVRTDQADDDGTSETND